MKHLQLFEDWVYLPHLFNISEEEMMSGQEIADYIEEITPDESDIPDFFISQVLKSKKKFVKKRVKISEVLAADPDVKTYVDSGEERYGEDSESDYEPHWKDLENPIVIFNGEVIDGYSRLSAKFHAGEKEIDAWVSV
jgi:hypothetical protein